VPTADGKLTIVNKADAPEDARVVKPKGKILTVTGLEATELGLAAGVADKLDDVKALLGHNAWHASDDRATWQMMESRARSARAEANRQNEKMMRELARREFIKSARPELRHIDDQITKAIARAKAAEDELKSIKTEYDEKVARLDAERDRTISTSTSVQTSARANDSFRVRRAELARQYLPRVKELGGKLREAAAEVEVLIERRKSLVTAVTANE